MMTIKDKRSEENGYYPASLSAPGDRMTPLGLWQWHTYRDVYGFAGNELLMPMNRSGRREGLNPRFWQEAPIPHNRQGQNGLNRLIAYASHQSRLSVEGSEVSDQAILGVSLEFTHLFIGPPRPVAAPWETLNCPASKRQACFGKATLVMRDLIAEEGFALSSSNRQYEDHMGIELLFLSLLCDRAAEEEESDRGFAYRLKIKQFIDEHPLRWIGAFYEAVQRAYPKGYFAPLVEYTSGVLEEQSEILS